MRKSSSHFTWIAATVALSVAACGGDPTGTDSGDPLTTAEVEALLSAFNSALDSTSAAAQRVSNIDLNGFQALQVPISLNESFDVTVPCESGSIKVSGSISGTFDDQTFASDLTMDVTWDANSCAISNETTTFTVSGAPEIKLSADMTFSETSFTMSGTEKGGFSYTSSDARAGSCAIDVTFDIVDLEATITGTICGIDASLLQTLGGA